MRIAALALILLPLLAQAHPSFVEHPVSGTREFTEGRRHFLRMYVAHTCARNGTYQNYQNLLHTSLLVPNAADAVITSSPFDSATGNAVANSTATPLLDLTTVVRSVSSTGVVTPANAVMSIKPLLSANWNTMQVHKGDVPAFGARNTMSDVRAMYWMGSKNPGDMAQQGFPNEYATTLDFVGTFGRLQGCVAKMRVYMAAVDACEGGNANFWIRGFTPLLSEAFFSASAGRATRDARGYSASFDIVRHPTNNPLPASCGAGEIVTVEASGADIDSHFGQHAFGWAMNGETSAPPSGPRDCPAGQHWMDGYCMDDH